MDTTESRTFAARLADLLRNERFAMADFLVALAEFDRRRGWIELGYSGLFPFLVRELRLSKAAAFFRSTAAGLLQRYPELEEPLKDGRLCITSLASLAKVITPANKDAVLPKFFYRSKQEAKAIVAELAPVQDPPRKTVVTVVPVKVLVPPAPSPETSSLEVRPDELHRPDQSTTSCPEPLVLQPSPSLRVEPLTPTETRIHVTVSPQFLEKLESARLALSHSMPGADAEDILTAGLDLLLARDAKRKGLVAKPRTTAADCPAVPGADYVPAAVRREVLERDEGRCQWPLDGGGICGSMLRTELDHVQPRCRGGRPVPEDLRVLCRFHNELSARLELGDAVMDRYTRDPRQPELSGLGGDTGSG